MYTRSNPNFRRNLITSVALLILTLLLVFGGLAYAGVQLPGNVFSFLDRAAAQREIDQPVIDGLKSQITNPCNKQPDTVLWGVFGHINERVDIANTRAIVVFATPDQPMIMTDQFGSKLSIPAGQLTLVQIDNPRSLDDYVTFSGPGGLAQANLPIDLSPYALSIHNMGFQLSSIQGPIAQELPSCLKNVSLGKESGWYHFSVNPSVCALGPGSYKPTHSGSFTTQIRMDSSSTTYNVATVAAVKLVASWTEVQNGKPVHKQVTFVNRETNLYELPILEKGKSTRTVIVVTVTITQGILQIGTLQDGQEQLFLVYAQSVAKIPLNHVSPGLDSCLYPKAQKDGPTVIKVPSFGYEGE